MQHVIARIRLILPIVMLAVAVPSLALAGGPTFHENGPFTTADDNFCDTGKTVDVAGRSVNNVWLVQSGGADSTLKVTFEYKVTLTNPLNNKSVIDSGAGSSMLPIVAGTEPGIHTHLFTENGLRSKLQLPGGGVVTRDAGIVTYKVTFDANDDVIDFEFVSMNGPHPDFDTGAWCTAAVEALGL